MECCTNLPDIEPEGVGLRKKTRKNVGTGECAYNIIKITEPLEVVQKRIAFLSKNEWAKHVRGDLGRVIPRRCYMKTKPGLAGMIGLVERPRRLSKLEHETLTSICDAITSPFTLRYGNPVLYVNRGVKILSREESWDNTCTGISFIHWYLGTRIAMHKHKNRTCVTIEIRPPMNLLHMATLLIGFLHSFV